MRSFKWVVVSLVVVTVVIGVPVFQFLRPAPPVTVASTHKVADFTPGESPSFNWPETGQAALVAVGVGELGHSGPQTPRPIASVTKVMTAYLVLKKHPLGPKENGPGMTVTKSDYQTYLTDKAKGESVLPVCTGEQLTERQALEGLLLPSGNNVANMLAKWSAGSEAEFVKWMNEAAKDMGMTRTHYADASGFSANSASTALDQVKLFAKAMQIDAFRAIVGKAQATLPVAGTVYNVNYRLGHGGIIGGKTGSTDDAGGCFSFASEKAVGAKRVLIVGTVLGQQASASAPSSLMTALDKGVILSKQAQAALHEVRVVVAGEAVGRLNVPWTAPQIVRPMESITVIGWNGMPLRTEMEASPSMKTRSHVGRTVGVLRLVAGEQKKETLLEADSAVAGPSYLWRLKRL